MKIYIFYLSLFGFILFWLIFFKPFEVEIANQPRANVELGKFVFSIFNTQGMKLHLEGDEAIQKATTMVIKYPRIQTDDKKLFAKKGVYEGKKILKLQGSIHYMSEELEFFTQSAQYFIEKKILYVPTPFRVVSAKMELNGSKMQYYLDLDKIVAYDIKAIVKSAI
ncbi:MULTISPECIES: LPS export ABC transporter periplasmic protein LptC [unclassified Nitratiruptor]|uniref:LPS export ABC transporter periplasmic protein LptC n=1 Tax=unclassified Nitratiruptor TaxID=2624044 RepID=UPI001914DC2E|nr:MULTISPECIES: LPS export ABC transporter periplasmic protein LptC [unclassified Nitratiruptor]